MQVIHKDGSILKHKFEAAGLGLAPFKYVGCSEKVFNNGDGTTKGGGTCDYCGTGIRWVFYVQSADGKKSGVGCDCIRHYNDKALTVVVESEMRKIKKAQAVAKKASKEAKAKEQIIALIPDYNAALIILAAHSHPNSYFASKGKTYADYIRFFVPTDPTTAFNAVKVLGLMQSAILYANKSA